ncbi:MgtC/SapB family protein [Rhodococcus sp. X156]|uniref:MgtC/SapB family protein n=1 Tax=Rhodococcus sp. X156 TaxID=2499145 RepID=UPI001F499259|nr:MgtC/SapB family protein [Rhodococcus sp. X156]
MHASDLLTGPGQGWVQLVELGIAFVLSALIGLEREVRGKSAGLRTQAIVGTSSALILLVGKYGFTDVVAEGVSVDPTRVASQIVSGIGFLGAGLIITRQGAVRGLTTAAAVWETAAIGMAAGAGLVLLAVVVTALHFVIVLGFAPGIARIPHLHQAVQLHITYRDGEGVLRRLLSTCGVHGWTVNAMTADAPGRRDVSESLALHEPGQVGVMMILAGARVGDASRVLAGVDGVTSVTVVDEESE